MWILKVATEGLPERTFRILPGNVRTLGRSTGADFIVDAALVSRVHCRLTALLDGGLGNLYSYFGISISHCRGDGTGARGWRSGASG